MLTGSLVRMRIQGNDISPSFVDPRNERLLERAEQLLAVVRRAAEQGSTRGEVEAACTEVEGTSTDHMLTRGLAKVLLDKCEFDTDVPAEPAEVRAAVFRLAARTGPLARIAGPTGRRTAAAVFAEAAIAGLTPEDMARALYGDLKEEQRIVSRAGPDTAEALLLRYNTALVQAMLLKAGDLRVVLQRPDPKRVRQLFRHLKFHELMFRVSAPLGDVHVQVDGPQSLLKQSTRYGLSLAKFFPALLLQPGAWKLEAQLHWGTRGLQKQLTLTHKAGLVSHYADRGAWRPRCEEWFETRWAELQTDWSLEPGAIIDLGGQSVLVPDFTFRNGRRVAHMDIVGFWRKGYLEKRLADTPPNVILAVSRRLAGEAQALPESMKRQLIEFAEVIPANKVLERLDEVAVTVG